jgi:hypothetical protein
MKLDDKQKKLLKTFCLYLGSYGTKEASIDFNFYNDSPDMDIWGGWRSKDVRVKIDGFDSINDFAEEITLPIIEDNISYYDYSGEVSFCVDCVKKIIYFTASIREMATNWTGEEWELSNIEELKSWKEIAPQITGYDEGVVEYEGSGDSGYIDDHMELDGVERMSLPADLEQWCYNKLESYGGWEINEGSQGKFIFDFKNGTITLNHGENYEQDVDFEINDIIKFG